MIIQTLDGVVVNRFNIEGSLKFGRTGDHQVQIDDLAVSSDHAEITQETNDRGHEVYYLQDKGSTNGTFLNEQRIEREQLHHNDTIRVGWNTFTFIDENEQNLEQTTKIKKSWIPGVYYTKDK